MSKTATEEPKMSATRIDELADTAYRLAQIVDGNATEVRGPARYWTVFVRHNQREIRVSAIDDEWNAGVQVYILNRSGVVIGSATLQLLGASARFVAEVAASLNREIQ